nr:uncharacterized protein LOC111505049 [Leptinotarsa decemlineata]XP_023015563.1 uncharacterized protein LOC111505049 [Leptinotarsa decemlineata]
METRITISSSTTRNESDFLHLTYNTRLSVEDAMISVDSRCCGRVSWDKSAPFSHKSKPSLSNSWMNANKKDVENEVMKDIKNIAMPKCPFPTSVNPENTEDGEADSKSLILVRCDFKKSAKVQPYYPKLYPYNRSTSLLKYFKEEQSVLLSNMPGSTRKNFKSDKSDVEENNETDRQRHKSEPPRPVANNAHDSTHEGQENVESNGYAPQSPESRKKELCRYLKLMNPADKKEVLKLENRRSTRVRNLTIMEEKKHKPLEREYVREKSVPRSTLKSFKQLDVMVEKCARSEDSSNGKLSFCVPFPPKSVFQEVNDFDTVMSTLVPKFKRICDKKNIKYTKFDMDENLKTPEVTRNNQMKCLDERKTPSRPIPKKNTSEEGNDSMKKKSRSLFV